MAASIEFLGEQDGNVEGILKERLCHVLRHQPGIERAFLARIRTAEAGESVALCILAPNASEADEEALVSKVGMAFSSIFAPNQHLDTVFLDAAQHGRLVKVCRPFFPTQDA